MSATLEAAEKMQYATKILVNVHKGYRNGRKKDNLRCAIDNASKAGEHFSKDDVLAGDRARAAALRQTINVITIEDRYGPTAELVVAASTMQEAYVLIHRLLK